MATTTTARALPRIRLPDSMSVLAERDFRVVWTGQAVSMVGTWMQAVAQSLVVLALWNSAFALGAVNFANATPMLFVMLFGGVLADRGDKRMILIVTQGVMCALAAIVGALVLFDVAQIWMILIATAALGVAAGYDMPAYQAFMPDLVPPEKISQVVGLNSSTFHGSRMVGPAMAGLIIAAWGSSTAYFLNAASFAAVIFSLLVVRYRPAPHPPGPARSTIGDLKAGFAYARERPYVRLFLLLTALNCIFLFPMMAILSPFYVTDVLHEGSGVLGLFLAGSGVGSLFGALALIWWPTQLRPARMWFGALAGPLGITVMAVTRDPALAVAAGTIVSLSFSSQLGLIQSMMQESTPREFRGRVMSLHGVVFSGTMPLAGIAASGLAVAFGLPAVMVASAGAYLILTVAAMRLVGGGVERAILDARDAYAAVVAA